MAHDARSSTASPSITLINPPGPSGMTVNREGAGGLGSWSEGNSAFLYPPHSLAHTAAVMRRAGWSVSLLDGAGLRLDSAAALQLVAADASLLAVQVSYIALDNDIEFLNRLRAARQRATILAIGASAAFVEPQLLERTDASHILYGEPEAILLPVCQMIDGGAMLPRTLSAADLPGAATGLEGRAMDLDALPFPAWDLIDLDRYGLVTVFASRGCADSCTYCPYAVGQGRRLRLRSAQSVVDEMAWLSATCRPRRVIMRDPVFAREAEHTAAICRGLIDRGLALPWECESRPEHFDASLLRLMRQAGCTAVKLGLETTSEPVLRRLRRIPPDGSAQRYLQQVGAVAAACRQLGIACRIFVMAGLPGQTEADVAETIAFLRQVRPAAVDIKGFHHYAPLPMQPESGAAQLERTALQLQALQTARPSMVQPPQRGLWARARRWLAERMPG